MISLALVGEYNPTFMPHKATSAAIQHSCAALGMEVQAEWFSTENLTTDIFSHVQGVWVVPGSPYKNLQNTVNIIQYAREHDIPCFGTCGGFQHIILEYARNVLGFQDAQHAEYDPYSSALFISSLACSLAGRTMRLTLKESSRVAAIYKSLSTDEQYYCNFGVNPEKVSLLQNSDLVISGADDEGEIRIVELPKHRFFVGTLFVPQTRSTPEQPHPLVSAFLQSLYYL